MSTIGTQRKLTNEQAREMRELYKQGGVTTRSLAKAFAVSSPVVSAILRGDTYKDAGGPLRPERRDLEPRRGCRADEKDSIQYTPPGDNRYTLAYIIGEMETKAAKWDALMKTGFVSEAMLEIAGIKNN